MPKAGGKRRATTISAMVKPAPSLFCVAACTRTEPLDFGVAVRSVAWPKVPLSRRRRAPRRDAAAAVRPESDLALQTLQVGAQLRRHLIADVAILFQRFVQDAFELRRHRWIQRHRSHRRIVQNVVENHRAGRAGKRQLARHHLIEHRA